MNPGPPPEIELAHIQTTLRQHVVERQRVTGDQPGRHVRRSQQRRRLTAEPDVGDGAEITVRARRHRREQQRHAVDEQRLHDAVHQPFAQPEEIEVAVQIAREAHERAAIVVAIAVVHAIEPRLNGVLQRPREQHHHQRGEQRDDRIADRVATKKDLAHQPENHGIDCGDRGQRGGVDQPALDDDLDVHQAVTDDRGGKSQRDEAEKYRSPLGAGDGRQAERKRQRVAGDERQRTERGAPDDPAQLPARRDGAHAPQRERHYPEAASQAAGEIQELTALHQRKDGRKHVPFPARPHGRGDTGARKQGRRKVQEWNQIPPGVAPGPGILALREHEREMQEERRQHQHGHHVAPVEDPVESVQPAAEREGEHAEERDAQPEEVQRRLMLGPPQPDRGANQQRKDADRCQREVQHPRSGRNRRDRHRDHLL